MKRLWIRKGNRKKKRQTGTIFYYLKDHKEKLVLDYKIFGLENLDQKSTFQKLLHQNMVMQLIRNWQFNQKKQFNQIHSDYRNPIFLIKNWIWKLK